MTGRHPVLRPLRPKHPVLCVPFLSAASFSCFFVVNMIGRLENAKSTIRGLALSSPQRPTVLQLERDYRQCEGEEIPYRALGYRDVTSFLRSITDAVHLDAHGFVHPVYTNANQHLRPLVEQQRPSYIAPHKRNSPIAQAAAEARTESHTPAQTEPDSQPMPSVRANVCILGTLSMKCDVHQRSTSAATSRRRHIAEQKQFERDSQALRSKLSFIGEPVLTPRPPSPPPVQNPIHHFDFSWVNVGDVVTLTTQHEMFSGTVSLVRSRVLELKDALELTGRSGCSRGATLLFYPSDICTLHKESAREGGQSAASPGGGLLMSLSAPLIAASGFIRIADLVKSVRLINSFDASYHAAVAHLRCQPVVGLDAMPRDFRESRKLNMVTLATTRAVYVFDLAALHKIYPEFGEIFTHKRPLKAVHSSPQIVDNLRRNFAVSMQGIFDTGLAYWAVKQEPNEFVEAVHDIFRVPKSYFEHEQAHWMYYHRPISRDTLKYMAKRAVYVLWLHKYLHGELLAKFNDGNEMD